LTACAAIAGIDETFEVAPDAAAAGDSAVASDASGVSDAGKLTDAPSSGDAQTDSSVDAFVPLTAVAITAGDEFACAIVKGGDVYCWGNDSANQLGFIGAPQPTPVLVKGLSGPATAIAAGDSHACALVATDAGAVIQCWGSSNNGESGSGGIAPGSVPGAPAGAFAIACGHAHSCAASPAGVYCWGDDSKGQLGRGGDAGATMNSTAAPVVGIGVVSALGSGNAANHTCAVPVDGGGIVCWGDDSRAQLGDGYTPQLEGGSPVPHEQRTPVHVSGYVSASATVHGGQGFSCAAAADSGVQCWGDSYSGELGNNATSGSYFSSPVDVINLSGAGLDLRVATGYTHACAIKGENQTLYCWGNDSAGEVGATFTGTVPQPFSVTLPSTPTAVACGSLFTCAITTTGVFCWGRDTKGELGDDLTNVEAGTSTPQRVRGF
jgi:alpha-tubulin suppressor-like RCC1 family protein